MNGEKIEDGGPAFPTEPNTQPGFYAHHGMSLRDWFAGQALTEIIRTSARGTPSRTEGGKLMIEVFALAAYSFADAMLRARSNLPTEES